jgi:hypothetical protein
MPYVAQNLIVESWTVLDLATPPGAVSGLTSPADVTLNLQRSSGTTYIAASEVVGWAETAQLGTYAITITPQNAAHYVLTLQEVSALTLQRNYRFTYEVLPAGAVFTPSYSNAFCAQSDIERYAGIKFTSTSSVTTLMAAGFAEERAGQIMAWCAKWGISITPTTVISGSRLEDLLRKANAIGAALDAVISWYTQVEPAENEKARLLLAQWISMMGDGGDIEGTLEIEIDSNFGISSVRTHISSGEVTLREEPPSVDSGLSTGMTMGKVW